MASSNFATFQNHNSPDSSGLPTFLSFTGRASNWLCFRFVILVFLIQNYVTFVTSFVRQLSSWFSQDLFHSPIADFLDGHVSNSTSPEELWFKAYWCSNENGGNVFFKLNLTPYEGSPTQSVIMQVIAGDWQNLTTAKWESNLLIMSMIIHIGWIGQYNVLSPINHNHISQFK